MSHSHLLCQKTLQNLVHEQTNISSETAQLRRLNALFLISSGMSCKSVAQLHDTSVRSIQRWVKNYQLAGIDGLKDQKKEGRPPTISKQQWISLKKDFDKGPLACGVTTASMRNWRQRHWTVPQLAEHLGKEYGIAFSLRQYQRLIIQLRKKC